MTRMRLIFRLVLALTVVSGTLVATSGAAFAGYQPAVKVQGDNTGPGGVVTIAGSSWTPGATVRITSSCFNISPVNATVNSLGRFSKPGNTLKTTLTVGQTCSVQVCEAPGFTRCKTVRFKVTRNDDDCDDDDDRSRQAKQKKNDDDCDDD